MKQKTLLAREGSSAPQAGLEPATLRLTAGCSTIELLWNSKRWADKLAAFFEVTSIAVVIDA